MATQRLPIPGSDNGTWGSILNGFLEVSHNSDGTLSPTAVATAGAITSINNVAPTSGNISLSASSVGAASATPSEAYSYIPGIVADGGVTDNYTTIFNYIRAVRFQGGQNNLVLPPGNIGIGTGLVIPLGVTLKGSGSTNSDGTKGTTLVPLTTGSPPTSLVTLSFNSSGLQDLNIEAQNTPTSGPECSYAVTISAQVCTMRNVAIYNGSIASLYLPGGNLQTIASDIYIRQNDSTGSQYAIYSPGGSDGQFVNCVFTGAIYVDNGQMKWSQCHFESAITASTTTLPLLQDLGGNTFTGCTFDTVLSGGTALIDRTGAAAPSIYLSPTFQQQPTTGTPVTGIPMIIETTTAGAGVIIIGGYAQVPKTGSIYTNFVQGAIASTIVRGVTLPASTLSSTFTDVVPPAGIFADNFLAGTLFTNQGNAIGFTTFTSVSASSVAMVASTLYTANTGASSFTLPLAPTPGQIFGLQRGTSVATFTVNANTGQTVATSPAGGAITIPAETAQVGFVWIIATTSSSYEVISMANTDASLGFVVASVLQLKGGLAFKALETKTSNYTTTNLDNWIECTTNAFTLTLGTSNVTGGQIQVIANFNTVASGNVITLATASGTIDQTSLPPLAGIIMIFDGTNWHTVGSWGLPQNTANRTTYVVPTPASGSTFTISATADAELHITCTTSSSITVTQGPSTGAEHTTVPTVTAPVGADYCRTISAGEKVIFTGTVANFSFSAKTL